MQFLFFFKHNLRKESLMMITLVSFGMGVHHKHTCVLIHQPAYGLNKIHLTLKILNLQYCDFIIANLVRFGILIFQLI
jgi:hypothetical protein